MAALLSSPDPVSCPFFRAAILGKYHVRGYDIVIENTMSGDHGYDVVMGNIMSVDMIL